MSLVGNLEDLSLPDILQIVSLSKKSGILTVERESLQGKIIIREGRVIQTVSPRAGKTLGELLTSRGLVSSEDLKGALEAQREGDNKDLLGAILVKNKLVEAEVLEKVVQGQIEEAIGYFLTWQEGTFNFELSEIKGRGEISVDPQAFILEKGIDTQWLVLEGTRLMDERSRGGGEDEPIEPDFIEEEGAKPATPSSTRQIILIDDEPVFRDMLKDRLTGLNYKVTVCEGVEDGIRSVGELGRLPVLPIVISDIVLPTTDGRGFLGGLELIEKVRNSYPAIPIIAITAYPDENVKGKVRDLGAKNFILKPGGEGGGTADKEFFDKLAAALHQLKDAPEEPVEEVVIEEKRPVDLQTALDEKKKALAGQEEAIKDAGLAGSELTLLNDMMKELQNPRATSEIGLLILRFAAELLNRAVLFVVKGGQAVGLGGFGVEVSGGQRSGGVRGISIPLDEPSILEEVVKQRSTFRGPPVHNEWNRLLMERLGGKMPDEAIAMPLMAGGKVRVILYGDNIPDDEPLKGVQSLEIFLTQAGLTLERVLLEKKIMERDILAKGKAAAGKGSGEGL